MYRGPGTAVLNEVSVHWTQELRVVEVYGNKLLLEHLWWEL